MVYYPLMSRLNMVLTIILAFLLLVARTDSASREEVTIPLAPTAVPTPTPEPQYLPVSFSIPKIGVNALIEAVGTDENGKMVLPEELTKAGWYKDGFRPGQKGNAVIAGHLDSTTGAGAIFYHLHELEPGDTMSVLDEHGSLYTFTVTRKETYPYDAVPIDEVFGRSDTADLNLVTCTGWWNAAMHNYSHRMVIYSKLTSKQLVTYPTYSGAQ